MKIYTRTGDKGKTSLFDGTRVLKSNERVDAYGTIDELNSHIGLAITQISDIRYQTSDIEKELEQIQHDLFEIGAALAMPHAMPIIGLENRPKDFELLIDRMTAKLPELRQFILPGGGKAGASFHIARTIARRAERKVVALMQDEEVDINILIYLNRLSDLFFTMARFANYMDKKKEVAWKKR